MLNPRSPIVNNMFTGGYPFWYPPNYSVGYNGYNGQGYAPSPGYYGNIQNGYYESPFQRMEREKEERKKAEEAQRLAVDREKRISRIAATYDGADIDEKKLDIIYNTNNEVNMSKAYDTQEEMHIVNILDSIEPTQKMREQASAIAQNNIAEYHNKFISPDAGLAEFLNSAGPLLVDGMMRDQKQKQRDLSSTYDSNAYKQRLGVNPYAGKFGNLDDMTIKLPDSIKNSFENSYNERRQAFIASITQGHH